MLLYHRKYTTVTTIYQPRILLKLHIILLGPFRVLCISFWVMQLLDLHTSSYSIYSGADLGSLMGGGGGGGGVQLLGMCMNLAPPIDTRTLTLHFLPYYGRDYG